MPSAKALGKRCCTRLLGGETKGRRHFKTWTWRLLWSLIGIGEIVLLPLDVLKIKRQTNPEAFRGRGVFRIVADEGMGLYRGAGWTAARNCPGSFAVRGVLRILLLILGWAPPWRSRSLTAAAALRRLGIHKGVYLQTDGLQFSNLAPEFRSIHCRSLRVTHRVSPLGRYQNSDPKPEFWKSRKRLQDSQQHDEKRRSFEFFQRPNAQAADDWSKISLQLLACADLNTCLWYGSLESLKGAILGVGGASWVYGGYCIIWRYLLRWKVRNGCAKDFTSLSKRFFTWDCKVYQDRLEHR